MPPSRVGSAWSTLSNLQQGDQDALYQNAWRLFRNLLTDLIDFRHDLGLYHDPCLCLHEMT